MGMIVQGKVYPDIQCYICKKPDVKEYDAFHISEEDAKDTGLPAGKFVCLECCLQQDEDNDLLADGELERKVAEQIKIRNGRKYGLQRGKIVDIESIIMRLQRRKKIDHEFGNKLLLQLQSCPWQERAVDIVWESK